MDDEGLSFTKCGKRKSGGTFSVENRANIKSGKIKYAILQSCKAWNTLHGGISELWKNLPQSRGKYAEAQNIEM